MKATFIFLLLAQVSWAGPFQQKGLFDFMLEDEASGIGPDDRFHEVPELEPQVPVCPFRCQCHLRVVQCSDLGEWGAGSLYLPCLLYSWEWLLWEFSILSFNFCNSKCERQCHLMRSKGSRAGEKETALKLGDFILSQDSITLQFWKSHLKRKSSF